MCPLLLFLSTNSMDRCLEWSLAWWAAIPGCILHPLPPGGRMCHQLTAATPTHLCIHPGMPPQGTCTLPLAHAETQSMNTRNISPALPTSTGKPPQAGRSSLWTLLWIAVNRLQAAKLVDAKTLNTFNQVHQEITLQRMKGGKAR